MQRRGPRHHRRREIDAGDGQAQAGKECSHVTGTAAGIADGRARTEVILQLLGERGQQRAVERLVD